MVDWQFFFLAWELKGKYPAILGNPQARELFDDGNALLDEIVAGGLLTAKGGYGFWPGRADGDDILIYPAAPQWPLAAAAVPVRMPMLRQQTAKPDGRPNRCLADYVAPEG
jgi:5-methyltetrahydrofolate--homocysteine methyltransferase